MSLRHQYVDQPVTPWGGMQEMKKVIDKTGISKKLLDLGLPEGKSNNTIDPVSIIESFWVSVWIGCFRFSHTAVLRVDEVLREIFGWKRVASGTTYGRFFRRCRSYLLTCNLALGKISLDKINGCDKPKHIVLPHLHCSACNPEGIHAGLPHVAPPPVCFHLGLRAGQVTKGAFTDTCVVVIKINLISGSDTPRTHHLTRVPHCKSVAHQPYTPASYPPQILKILVQTATPQKQIIIHHTNQTDHSSDIPRIAATHVFHAAKVWHTSQSTSASYHLQILKILVQTATTTCNLTTYDHRIAIEICGYLFFFLSVSRFTFRPKNFKREKTMKLYSVPRYNRDFSQYKNRSVAVNRKGRNLTLRFCPCEPVDTNLEPDC